MKPILYAMDTCFGMGVPQVVSYSAKLQCYILEDLSYDGTYLTTWGDIDLEPLYILKQASADVDIPIVAVYAMLDISDTKLESGQSQIVSLINRLPAGCDLELAVLDSSQPEILSDPHRDTEVIRAITPVTEAMSNRSSDVYSDSSKMGRILLYPHFSFLLEKFSDVTRLATSIDSPLVGTVFCGIHWFIADQSSLPDQLEEGFQYLGAVNLSGLSKPGEVGGVSVHSIDQGQMDNYGVIHILTKLDYTNRIGIQGFGVGGDVYKNLQRSRDALLEMCARAEKYSPL